MTVGELRALAEAVAREAGALLRGAYDGPELRVSAKSTPTDLVREADHAAERLIRERLQAARPGNGVALLDGSPISASTRTDLSTAMVGTGFGYDAEVRRAQAEVVARLLPDVRDIRRLGSAALDLAWTACGRLDAYYEHGLNAWDLAAGRLICERAGLEVRDLPPVGPSAPGVLVAPPALAAGLLERLA